MSSDFVDASTIYEAITNENSKSLDYLYNNYRGTTKILITSTHAIGEVIRRLYLTKQEYPDFNIDKIAIAFQDFLDSVNLQIENVTDKTLKFANDVIEKDSRTKFKDALHVAIAYECYCNKFITLDTGFNKQTLKDFNLKLELIKE